MQAKELAGTLAACQLCHDMDLLCRLVDLQVISTLGVPADKVLPCIECWCQDGSGTQSSRLGSGACCSSQQCRSTEPETAARTYELQYIVRFR